MIMRISSTRRSLRDARARTIVLGLFATALAGSVVAVAQIDYRGLIYARTSGNTCKEATPALEHLSYTKAGVKNESGQAVSVWCPIVRRNSTPVGRLERGDSSPGSAFVPTAKLEQLSVDVHFTPQASATACTVYGRLPGSMGGVFFSPTRFTCTTDAPGCARGQRSQTLSWRAPLHAAGARPLVNLGFRCDLPNQAGVIGSVASFSGDFVPEDNP